jgi:hypothetical protein
LTGLALLGNIEPPDPELNKALQPVLNIMHKKYVNGVLIVKSIGADLFVGVENHFFNQRMMEEYLADPKFGLTNEILSKLTRIE